MSQQTDFQVIQYQFAAYIRDPEQNPAPDNIEARRMKIYAELFYNNVEDFMS
ncbi:MAG: DNA-binding domain-containing protein, partial [Gammaproteobacteria bacterium]|nr:DNA-binding domain-containing protein [Gammaproteobacteria bacterium]